MNKKSLDPAGHLTLAVSNLEKSKIFYKSLFGKLKFKQIRDGERSVAWATRDGFGIWIRKAKHTKPRYKYFAPGLQHLCVKAKTRKAVDEIYKIMSAKKTFVFDEPKAYPEYTPKYYAVFFADPDGIKIEVAYY
ncbi:MAG: glyoxalase/bleomycin resistance protein/dioxygenase [Parcubacteria group bacterium Gr01-1014_30]|nr:MAG: glyoxalase/bleomycin resistance protein/dioxygenase [Parcubacteria group bacterium Gr01-1014_30]